MLSLLLGQQMTQEHMLSRLLEPGTLVLLIPITAVVVGGVTSIVSMMFRHRERMRMIELGIHPDLAEDPAEKTAGTEEA